MAVYDSITKLFSSGKKPTAETQTASAAYVKEMQQRENDNAARVAFASAGVPAQTPAAPASEAPATAPTATTPKAISEDTRKAIAAKWAEYSTTAGKDSAKSYSLLTEIKTTLAAATGKDAGHPESMTQADFAQAGLRRDYFLSALSDSAFEVAKSTFGSTNRSVVIASRKYEGIKETETVLKDTAYYQAGGMPHAMNVLCSVTPDCKAEGINDVKKRGAERAADRYANMLVRNDYEPLEGQKLASKFFEALSDAGKDYKSDDVMRSYVGKSYNEFVKAMSQTDDAIKAFYSKGR